MKVGKCEAFCKQGGRGRIEVVPKPNRQARGKG